MASDRDVQPDFNDDSTTKKSIGQKRSRSNVHDDPQQLPNKRARYDANTTIHKENNNGHNHNNKSWPQLEPNKKNAIKIELNNINTKVSEHTADSHHSQNGQASLPQNNTDNITSNALVINPIDANHKLHNHKHNDKSNETESKDCEEIHMQRSRSRSHSVSSSQSLSSVSRSPSRSRSRSYSKRKRNRHKNRNRKRRNHRKNRKEYSRSNGSGSHSNGNRLRLSRSLSRRKHSKHSHSHSRSRRSSSIRHNTTHTHNTKSSSSHLLPANMHMAQHNLPFNNAHNALLVGGQHINFPKTNILPSVLQTNSRGVECIASIALPQSGPQKFKTTLCSNYMSGGCRFGARCHFAHGSNELRGCKAGAEAEKIWRSKLCREFAKGTCHWGAKCRFAHGATTTKDAPNSPNSCANCTESMAMVERYKNEMNQLQVENQGLKEEIESYKRHSNSKRKASK